MLVNELQSSKDDISINVMLDGIFTLAKEVQPAKANPAISVTPDGIFTLVKEVQPSYLLLVDYQYYTL